MPLPESLIEQVLTRLSFSQRPDPTLSALRAIYGAWCQRVPFDNVQKLVHLRNDTPAPLPGTEAEDFLQAWLQHGTGGTCWAGSTALLDLLTALGFEAERGIATMLVAPDLPPNHGTVRVQIENQHHLVDSSILFGEPLLLDDAGEAHIKHPAWGVQGTRREGLWHIHWRPLNKTDGLECRYDRFAAEPEEYHQRHEDTRGWSPFNYQLTARRNRGDEVIGASFGEAVTLHADGRVESHPISDAERRRMLIEDFGMSEEIVSRMPEDRPTPPPPGSKTAAEADS
jgi:arylamine N-acetyltransferase